MSPLRVLLADDEPLALERLVFAFGDIPDTEIVATATNGLEALDRIAALQPDLAVLDIQMPGRSGLGVAAALPVEQRPEIVFLTAFEGHALDAFDVEAADYVLKPLRLDRLRQAVERVRRRLARDRKPAPAIADAREAAEPVEGDDAFWIPGRNGLVRIALQDVQWVEAAKDYVLLHTAARSHILRATMASIEARFPPPALLRVHRSALVRSNAVQALQPAAGGGSALVLDDGVAVPVGPSYMADVRRRFGG